MGIKIKSQLNEGFSEIITCLSERATNVPCIKIMFLEDAPKNASFIVLATSVIAEAATLCRGQVNNPEYIRGVFVLSKLLELK